MKTNSPAVYNSKTDEVPSGAVFIGRPSEWGNPFIVGVHGDRAKCIRLYRKYIDLVPGFRKRIISQLRGHNLVCVCRPKECHGDVLLEIANS